MDGLGRSGGMEPGVYGWTFRRIGSMSLSAAPVTIWTPVGKVVGFDIWECIWMDWKVQEEWSHELQCSSCNHLDEEL